MTPSATASITIKVPASTSNCGSGFDTLGIALSLYNFVRIQLQPQQTAKARYEGQIDQREQTEAMGAAVAAAFEEATGRQVAPFSFEVWGQVPLARGLGSSSTVWGGLIAGLNHLYGSPLDLDAQTEMGCRLDGNPDNATALFNGGFTIARTDTATGAYLGCMRCDVDEELAFVVISPQVKVFTGASRSVLPPQLPFKEVIHSINSVCTLTAAFFARDYAALKGSVADFIHQPYRSKLTPFMYEAIAAGEAAGAWCGWLSGSGSSVLCVAPRERAQAVGEAMAKVYADQGIEHEHFCLQADNQGLRPTSEGEALAHSGPASGSGHGG